MNIILLQARLTLQEVDLLLKEFPQYLFLSLSEVSYKTMAQEYWNRVEVIYGGRLTAKELETAHQLRWIHSPTPHLTRLCLEDIEKQGNILLTNTLDENVYQVGEYVMAGVLAFGKNLIKFSEANKFPALLWNSKWRESMWTLKNRTFLQIGLGIVGTEICRRAKLMDMKVWGIQPRRSFHPYCQKIFPIKDLSNALPDADVVCISLPRTKEYENWFQEEELGLMKKDSILVILGSNTVVNEGALAAAAQSGKLRGILMDAFYQTPIPLQSPLWKIPDMIITPEVSPRPKSTERQSFRLFMYNLRQYLHGNFKDMRNLITED